MIVQVQGVPAVGLSLISVLLETDTRWFPPP
jgi:hypothetical protein